MAFHEDWFPIDNVEGLRRIMASVAAADGSVVEVGCWEGRSTIEIAKAMGHVHAIDPWSPEWWYPSFQRMLKERWDPAWGVPPWNPDPARDVLADFIENIEEAGVADRVVIHQSDWRSVDWARFAPIRFLFIDGEHSYDDVFDNVEVARPLMAPDGVIAGDDFDWDEVARAVRAQFSDVSLDGRIWFIPA